MDNTNYRTLILTAVRSHPRRKVTVNELRRDLQAVACIDLNSAAIKSGFSNIIEYLMSLSDILKITVDGPRTTVEAIQTDHISEMNKYSKRTLRGYSRPPMDREEVQELYVNNRRIYLSENSDIDFVHDSAGVTRACPPEVFLKEQDLEEDYKPENEPMIKLPYQNISKRFTIDQKAQSDSTSDDEQKDSDLNCDEKLHALLNMRKLNLLVGNKTRENPQQVDQVTNDDKENESRVEELCATLKENSIASAKPSIYAAKMTSELTFVKNIDKSIPQCLDIQFTPEKGIKSIVILETINPHRYWFCESDDFNDHKKLRDQMYLFYNGAIESFKINSEDMKQGLVVAVLHKNGWRRGKVLKLLYETQYRVFLVDYGAVIDKDLSNFRYLKEDFLQFPTLARRGVLAYVQPIHKYWSNDANRYFYKKVHRQNVNAKIYCVSKENSYYMSLKTQNNELLSNEIVVQKFGTIDLYFLRKDPVNSIEMAFEDYENGKYADISTAAALQAVDSWIPKVENSDNLNARDREKDRQVKNQNSGDSKSSKSVFSHFRGNTSTSQHQNNQLFSIPPPTYQPPVFQRPPPPFIPKQFTVPPPLVRAPPPPFQHSSSHRMTPPQRFFGHPLMNRNFNSQMMPRNIQPKRSPRKRVQLNEAASDQTLIASSVGSSPEKEKVVEIVKWQIEPQKYETMAIDSEISINILRVEKSNLIYFYNFEELVEISKFMDEFNASYKQDRQYHTLSEIQLEKDVVVFHSKNFCRGRVVSQVNSNEFEIFLLDYGSITTRKVKEMYYLKKEFMHRQAVVYKGRITSSQSKNFDNDQVHEMLLGLREKMIVAKIVAISNDVIELKLINGVAESS